MYLEHHTLVQEVAADISKIHAIENCPTPFLTHVLRGFLGLMGYYQSFVKDYDKIAKPLTNFLKVTFHWSDDAYKAFTTLKTKMTQLSILALPDFTKQFVVECNESWGLFRGGTYARRAPHGLLQQRAIINNIKQIRL